MADMVNVEGLKKLKEEHPEALVVSYVNSSLQSKQNPISAVPR